MLHAGAGESASSGFPEQVGRYELLLPIASGGMATVYLARARGAGDFEREVALKLLHAHLRETDFTTELIEEAKLAVRIRHPNVVPVLDVGEDKNGTFLVMDYVEGETLSGLWRAAARSGGALPLGVGLRILLDSLAGLHAAHELVDRDGRALEVVHRDYSPQNILVGVDGIAKLTDFGIAKAATRSSFTRTGMIKGKFAYMSPEQARDEAIDRRCDVWAAGVVAWEIVAKRRLFRGDNDAATLLSLINDPVPALRSVGAGAPAALEDAIARALTKSARDRTATAAALARAIERVEDEGFDIATHEEVARTVRALVGAKLEKRQAAMTEMITLRRRMAAVAKRADSSTESPVAAAASAEATPTVRETPPLAARSTTEPPLAAAVATETPSRRPRSRTLWIASAVIGGAIAAAVVLARAGSGDAREVASPIVSASIATGLAPPPGATAATTTTAPASASVTPASASSANAAAKTNGGTPIAVAPSSGNTTRSRAKSATTTAPAIGSSNPYHP